MSDLSQEPGLGTGPPTNMAGALNSVLKSAPELSQSPGLAVGVASSGGDATGRAQAVAHATNTISDANAKRQVSESADGDITGALDWFGNHVASAAGNVGHEVVQGAEKVGSTVLNTVNKPLQIVQHEYRYLHDVEASHGRTAALLEGLGIAAGAAGGFAAGGFYGAEAGAELAAGAESQMFYKDSWARTAAPSYADPHTHQQVSLGRDITSFVGNVTGDQSLTNRHDFVYRLGSGLIDGIFDMSLGGQETLGLVGKAHSAEGIDGFLNSRWGGTAPKTLGDAVGGPGVTDPNEIDRIYHQYGSVRRAFGDIADKSYGELAATPAYAGLRDMWTPLGDARTPEEVAQVFKEALAVHQLAFTDRLPTLSWTRATFGQALREAVENFNPEARGPTGLLARQAQRMTALPTSWNDMTQQLTMKDFDPSHDLDDGSMGIYRMARFTESRRVAASIVDDYHNAPDLESKIRIYRNLSLNTLFSMAGFRGLTMDEVLDARNLTDPPARAALARAINDAVGGGMFGKEAAYGYDDQGRGLSLIHDPETGWQYGAGIWQNQTGRLRFLDLNEARRAGKAIRGAKDVLGQVGDFGYDHITQGFFKPLVLLTPSYAMHIALAEMIPNALREGVLKLARDQIDLHVAKLGLRIGEAEDAGERVPAIAGLAWKLVNSGMDHLPTSMSAALERRLELASRYIEYNDGALQAPGLASGHAYQEEVASREENSVSLLRRSVANSPKRTSTTFAPIGAGTDEGVDAWQAALKEPADDPAGQLAARKLLDGLHQGKDIEAASADASRAVAEALRADPQSGRFLRVDPRLEAPGFENLPDQDNYDQFARVKVAALRGLVRGMDKSTHEALLEHIAAGEMVDRPELEAIPEASRPILVKDREQVPAPPNTIQKIANVGFRRVLNPMVNFLSRQPIGFNEFERQWALEEPYLDKELEDYDEAMAKAMSRTVTRVMRNVHNLTDRTQWTVTMRNWAPFFFAQEQAYRRMGRLLAEDPLAFRRYQLMISNVGHMGQIFQGPNGQNYFVMPGTGFLTSGVARGLSAIGLPVTGSAPVGMGWNLSASSVIFPLSAGIRPDIGPLVSVPVDAIAKAFPEHLSPVLKSDVTSVANTILGPSATQSIFEQMIPNTIAQRIATAFGIDNRTLDSTVMQTMQMLDLEGKLPSPTATPMQMQTFIDRVTNQSRVMYIMKAIVGGITPVSPEIQIANLGLPTELQNDITAQKSVIKGTQEFLNKHPDATPLTVFQSGSAGYGVSVPESVAAENWIDEHMADIDKYAGAYLMLMPANIPTNYSQTVYNQQIAQGLRAKWGPGGIEPNGQLEGYLAQLYVAAGNAIVLDKWYPQYEKALQGTIGSERYQIEQNWYNVTLPAYGQQNPVWYEWWQSDLKDTQRGAAINQMRKLLASPDAPKTEIANQTRQLLAAYDAYEQQIVTGTEDGFIGQTKSELTQGWEDNLYATVAAHPGLTNVVNGLFLSIPTTGGPAVPATAAGESATPGLFTAKTWSAP